MEDLSISLVDLFAVAVVVLGLVIGLYRRLSGEIAHLVSVGVAFVIGIVTYRPLALWLLTFDRLGERSAHAAAFLSVIVGSAIAMYVIRYTLQRIMRVVIEEHVDRIGGAVAGATTSAVLVIIVFIAMNLIPSATMNRAFGEESVIGRVVLHFLPRIQEEIPAIEESVIRLQEGELPVREVKEDEKEEEEKDEGREDEGGGRRRWRPR